MSRTVLLLGAFDSKGPEYAFVRERLIEAGCDMLTVNFGPLGSTDLFPVDIGADALAEAAGTRVADLLAADDRGAAMVALAAGAAIVARRLFDAGRFDGILGLGGTGGTSVITAAMRALPLGVPKVCVSTAAGGDVSAYVGCKDVVLIPSIVDVAGVNRISRIILTRAAGAVAGMIAAEPAPSADDRPLVAASMFGNTTTCVNACRQALEAAGYEVLVFHATGTGGRAMEALIDEGLVDACLDITTTEWADEVCGGVFSAGPDRLAAPGRAGIPHLVVPGCIDMANFGPLETVPQRYRDAGRNLYVWNPAVTLMRTDIGENQAMGRAFAAKLNAAAERGSPVRVLIPLRGVSILDGDGQPFRDRAADAAFVESLRAELDPRIPVVMVDANINDAEFSGACTAQLLNMMPGDAP